MMRDTTDPIVNENGDETHPAFGTAVVTRSSGSGRPLFQSDLLHRESMTLSIHRAVRKRDLNHDWVHTTDEIVRVTMSLAQWGALVSSVGIGSGTPVTIERTETEGQVPHLPYQPRIERNITEVRGSVSKLLKNLRDSFSKINDAFESKKGIKAMRAALREHETTLTNAESNASFAVKSMQGAAENLLSQARADVEVLTLQAQRRVGESSEISAPDFDRITLEPAPADPTEEQENPDVQQD